ncbi:MAG: hypothetical protein JSS49_20205 [Planctomycetes bacterium]|nr:hypothetical protein [Planctomycetota bacterium]
MNAGLEAPELPARCAIRQIELRGVRVHNLKQIDLDLPLGKLVVLSGVSGSGKSSLAFDTIFAEGQRRYIESFSTSARQYLERIERPNADRIAHVPPAFAIRTGLSSRTFSSQANVGSLSEIDLSLRRLFARLGQVVCPDCGCEVRAHSVGEVVAAAEASKPGSRFQVCFRPTSDGPNSPSIWLARGYSRAISEGRSQSLESLPADFDLQAAWIVVDRLVAGRATEQRIAESAEAALREGNGRCLLLVETVESGSAESNLIVDDRRWQIHHFSRHWECSSCHRQFLPPEPRLFDPTLGGGCDACRELPLSQVLACRDCRGTKLRPEARAVQIHGHHLEDVLRSSVDAARKIVREITSGLTTTEWSISQRIRQDLDHRLALVSGLGLGHLTVMRSARTLTGGQVRRLMLASAIGSRLTGTLCLIDEPSAGLDPSEMQLVLDALRQLLNLRNSVIVVDHAPQIIQAADYVVDLGPGAGPQGGSIVFTGTPDQLTRIDESATGRALRAASCRVTGRAPRRATEWLTLTGIEHRNLRDLTVRFPLGCLCVVSGPGGSGKSSLVMEALVPALRSRFDPAGSSETALCWKSVAGGDSLVDLAVVDRSPLTRSSRSNAATWIEVFDEIRDVFALTADARQRGFASQHFSFNAAQGGRCRACRGTGVLRHDLQFLPDVNLACPECSGTRYRREILDVKYKGRSIADVLSMSAAEAATFFRNHPRLQARLQMLKQIGLEYLVLGQPTETLSGGEAQRLRLAARLTSSRGPTMIVCDEATVGLHPADVSRLVGCFDELLGIGHSIVVVDNSPDLRSAADHVIDLDGGRLMREGLAKV